MNNSVNRAILLDWVVAWLSEHLRSVTVAVQQEVTLGEARADAIVSLAVNGASTLVVLEFRSELSPRAAMDFANGPLNRGRSANKMPLLLVAPFLSPRTQSALRAENLNYIDQTGNSLIQLSDPFVYIETNGATMNPRRSKGDLRRVTFRGKNAGRLIRCLVDFAPPYTVTELAQATELDLGNVSRILDSLAEYGVITRGERGRVVEVDIRSLLALWAETYSVLKTNSASLFISPRSAAKTFDALAGNGDSIVTGPFAETQIRRIAAPTLLIAYTTNVNALAGELKLMPTDEAANVILLEPFDQVVEARSRTRDGVRLAAVSQVAIDCLTGPGRMPPEGTAIVEWMTANETLWRSPSLPKSVAGASTPRSTDARP
jgi:hypothetical protein